jgi:hypothetical protein
MYQTLHRGCGLSHDRIFFDFREQEMNHVCYRLWGGFADENVCIPGMIWAVDWEVNVNLFSGLLYT